MTESELDELLGEVLFLFARRCAYFLLFAGRGAFFARRSPFSVKEGRQTFTVY